MDIKLAQTTSLLSTGTRTKPNVFDLVTGKNQQDTTIASLSGMLANEQPTKTATQQTDALTKLENYVKSSVKEADAPKLLKSISGLRSLLELGSDPSLALDPVFSVLASDNSSSTFQQIALERGSLIDQLV